MAVISVIHVWQVGVDIYRRISASTHRWLYVYNL